MDKEKASTIYESHKNNILNFESELTQELRASNLFIIQGQIDCCGDVSLDSSSSLTEARTIRLKRFEKQLLENLADNEWIAFWNFKYEVDNNDINPINSELINWIGRQNLSYENWNYIFDEGRYIYWGEIVDSLNNTLQGIQIKGQVIHKDSLLFMKTADVNYDLIILSEL